jgi:hypothetical protein
MSSWPFGSPTLARYIEWAEEIGCEVSSSTTEEGLRIFTIRRDKTHSIAICGDLDERLTPTTVARYDRRLDVKSPFCRL